MAHIRLADGSHRFIDGQSTVPLAVRPDTYTSKPGSAHDVFDTVGDENLNGPKAVAVPGSLKAWCETLQRFGTMALADVMQPAIKHASRGYAATPYLHECITDSAAGDAEGQGDLGDLSARTATPLKAGERVVQAEYAETLTYISQHGEAALYHGPLGDILVDYMKSAWRLHHPRGSHRLQDRRARSRSAPIIAAGKSWARRRPRPPACTSRRCSTFSKATTSRSSASAPPRRSIYLAEVLKIAFADRAAASGDPDFVNVPVERLTSKAYADERRRAIDPDRAQAWSAGVAQLESAHTTHMTAADAFGNVVATTQTINNLFGAQDSDSRPRHRAEQLHEPVRSAARPRAVAGAGQARHHLDVADDGAARRQAGLCARPARRKADLSERDAGADQSDRPRHEPAGGGRGAAGLDRGQCARGRTGGARKRSRQARPRWATRCRRCRRWPAA